MKVGDASRPVVGDLVVSKRGHWQTPRLVVEESETAKALIGVLSKGETRWIHYEHLEIVNAASR